MTKFFDKYGLMVGVVLIILFGLFIRTYGLDKSPASANFDEAALGYNAYSIMKTGKDEYGNAFPLSLRSFNDYKPALYSYLSIPFIYVLGLNETSTRMVSAVSGTLSLIFLFFFLREFIKNKKYLLLVFFILSLEPWRLHFSRTAFESNLSMFCFSGGAWFLYSYLKDKKKVMRLAFSIGFLGLAAYSYHSSRLAAPLMLLLVLIDPIVFVRSRNWLSEIKKTIQTNFGLIMGAIMLVMLCLPIFLENRDLVLTRFKQENIFSRYYPYAPGEVVEKSSVLGKLGNNPIYYLGALVTGHIVGYVSPINLGLRIFHWVRGSPQFIPGFSMLGWIESMVFLVGLVLVFRKVKLLKSRLLIYWIIAGIAPAAVTWNWFHPLRSLNIFPALEIVTGLGLFWIYNVVKSKKLKYLSLVYKFFLTMVFVMTMIFTINNELLYSIWENNGEYQPGSFKEGMKTLMSLQNNYDRVIIDSPHAQSYIFFLFYQSFPPEIVQSYSNIRPLPGVEGNLNFNFDKYVFRKFDWPQDRTAPKTLFWTSSEVKRDEIIGTPGARLFQFKHPMGYIGASLIVKD